MDYNKIENFTIKELIEKLKEFPDDLDVIIFDEDGWVGNKMYFTVDAQSNALIINV